VGSNNPYTRMKNALQEIRDQSEDPWAVDIAAHALPGEAKQKPQKYCASCGSEIPANRKYCSHACKVEATHPSCGVGMGEFRNAGRLISVPYGWSVEHVEMARVGEEQSCMVPVGPPCAGLEAEVAPAPDWADPGSTYTVEHGSKRYLGVPVRLRPDGSAEFLLSQAIEVQQLSVQFPMFKVERSWGVDPMGSPTD
jgi:predicted RNA-binding Zn-ribbon protein involved in translation (DUF1610 family)